MELTVGPFDPVLHVRSRDHYQALRREAQLLGLQPGSPPRRYEALMDRFAGRFLALQEIDAAVDRAYRAGERRFTARVVVADELVPEALAACDEADALLHELDRWTGPEQGEELLSTPEEVKLYRDAVLRQIREQLERGPAARGERARG
ncbi:MAG TPA: hypothetical protein VKG45_08735 [Actinomycetes bacterium]|nr:hypothetical protein [Actinomycetes bacterium]